MFQYSVQYLVALFSGKPSRIATSTGFFPLSEFVGLSSFLIERLVVIVIIHYSLLQSHYLILSQNDADHLKDILNSFAMSRVFLPCLRVISFVTLIPVYTNSDPPDTAIITLISPVIVNKLSSSMMITKIQHRVSYSLRQ